MPISAWKWKFWNFLEFNLNINNFEITWRLDWFYGKSPIPTNFFIFRLLFEVIIVDYGFVYISQWPNSRLIDLVLTKNNIFPFSIYLPVFSLYHSPFSNSLLECPIFLYSFGILLIRILWSVFGCFFKNWYFY